jgi:hypothetical protein
MHCSINGIFEKLLMQTFFQSNSYLTAKHVTTEWKRPTGSRQVNKTMANHYMMIM